MPKLFDQVHKFGGTSLSDASCIRRCIEQLPQSPCVVVVSAMAGVTNQLEVALQAALNQTDTSTYLLVIREQYASASVQLLADNQPFVVLLDELIAQVVVVLETIALAGDCSASERAEVLGLGELLSARLFAMTVGQQRCAKYVDAHGFLFVDDRDTMLACDWQRCARSWQAIVQASDVSVWVVTGFLASDLSGNKIVLERNGSDISAAYVARLCQAKTLVIWSDQDGIYSANPVDVPAAFVLSHINYQEALEMAYFGASIVHPKMIAPAMEDQRTIKIKNSFRPWLPGSCIDGHAPACDYALRGLSGIDDLSLITVEGAGMMGVSGVAARTFSALQEENISVILITQASSEHSICFCVASCDARQAQVSLNLTFIKEIRQSHIQRISCQDHVAIIAAVGDGMVGKKGVAGRMCQTLAHAQINIIAMAQGSSERNISVVIDSINLKRGLRALHGGFYLSRKTIAVALIGVGVVGSALLEQIRQVQQRLQAQEGIVLLVRAIMDSRRLLLGHEAINLDSWSLDLANSTCDADMDELIEHMNPSAFPHAVVIDCTANESVASFYERFLDLGLHVITPNKHAGSGDFDYYQRIMAMASRRQRHFLYETTVCSGLPVIHTLQDILRTGDQVKAIEGVVSGSLSYIFNQVAQGHCFSDAVKSAKQCGYTEPDPREDLSGNDVVRKMVCLSRELGFSVNMCDVSCVSLVPELLRACSVDEFLKRVDEFDDQFNRQMESIRGGCARVAYVGQINDQGEVKVALQGIDAKHPFAHLHGTDNMIVFKTNRYNANALIIRGPGAGADVTAAGVFADLLRLITYIKV